MGIIEFYIDMIRDFFDDVRYKRFIDVALYLGINKKYWKSEDIWNLFDMFNRLRYPIGEYEEQWGLPKDIHPKTTVDLFPPYYSPVKGYCRSKEFYVEERKSGFKNSIIRERRTWKKVLHQEKLEKGDSLICFFPKTKYSPKELGKDYIFLVGFSAKSNKDLQLPSFRTSQLVKEEGVLKVETQDNLLFYKYPLKDRIRLHLKDKELDKFIFGDDLEKLMKSKFFRSDKGLYKEANRIFEDFLAEHQKV